ncbi:hypothetical protein M2302_000302 [Micromonospora sp. A200]|nr:hypothetical protein [Micromonospora sp. A200]
MNAHGAVVALFLTLALLWAAIAGPALLMNGSL